MVLIRGRRATRAPITTRTTTQSNTTRRACVPARKRSQSSGAGITVLSESRQREPGGADARQECPTASDDADGDGTLNTTDGGPAYGPIVVSLTKTGDTSPDSGLAVERFDTAPGGDLSYERGSIKVSEEVATAVADAGDLGGLAAPLGNGADQADPATD